jgi:hypothetical protein
MGGGIYSLLLKSAKELVYDPQFNGELAVKEGQLTVVQQKPFSIKNIHAWTSAFMIYMGIMLEKWPNKGQEYLKYMCNVRFAADRGSGTGWVLCDEQYRLRKVRYLFSSWGELDMVLWFLYVTTQDKTCPNPNTNSSDGNPSFQRKAPFSAGNRGPQKVRGFNKGNCQFGKTCRFADKCSNCLGPHPLFSCRA